MTKRAHQIRLPFPFTSLAGKRARSTEAPTEDCSWQAYYDRAEQIYYSKEPARRKSYKIFAVNALKALSLAQEDNHLKRIADTYALLSRFHFEVEHPDRIKTLRVSVVAAQNAYGMESKEAAVQMAGLALVLEESGCKDEATATRLRAFEIMEKCTTSAEKLQLNDNALCLAMEAHDSKTALQSARRGIQLTQALVNCQSPEFMRRIDFYVRVIACFAENTESPSGPKPENNCICGQQAECAEVV